MHKFSLHTPIFNGKNGLVIFPYYETITSIDMVDKKLTKIAIRKYTRYTRINISKKIRILSLIDKFK